MTSGRARVVVSRAGAACEPVLVRAASWLRRRGTVRAHRTNASVVPRDALGSSSSERRWPSDHETPFHGRDALANELPRSQWPCDHDPVRRRRAWLFAAP
ncbi:MAG: hypothetical protein K1X88_31195 [Nannocystaceae bacterium]|nr:hypothetical protein [Nannocystaceae bacterium]